MLIQKKVGAIATLALYSILSVPVTDREIVQARRSGANLAEALAKDYWRMSIKAIDRTASSPAVVA